MNDNKRAWLYCQVGNSEYAKAMLEIQKLELQNFAECKGCIVVGISEDIGSSRYLGRRGMEQMLNAAQHNQFDILLVARYESLCHDMEPMTAYICQLQALGLDVCSPIMGSVKNYDDFRVDADLPGSEMD